MRAFVERSRRTLTNWIQRQFERWASKRSRHEHSLTLSHKSIYVVPTGFGLAWIVLFIAIWIGGANYDNNAARFLAWWLLSILLIAPYLSYRYLSGIQVRLLGIDEQCKGQQTQLHLAISAHRATISVQVEDHPWLHLPPEQSQVSSHFVVPRRGRYTCPTIRIESRLPFGMFRCWSILRYTTEGLGYPAPMTSTIVPTRQSSDDGSETSVASIVRSVGSDFDSLKRYEEGDPLARVDWKALAKTEQLYSKQYGTAVQSHRHLDLDAVSGDIEHRLSILCYWLLQAQANEQAVGLTLGNEHFAEASGDEHTKRLLRALANYGGGEDEF